tara:strand:+ start:1789 stop:3261 length:1473 start_codon:yes stop_codon:yes gene_type:complete
MATRTVWQDIYTVLVDKTSSQTFSAHIAASTVAYAVDQVGIQGDKTANGRFSMPLNDHPNFKAPSGTLESEQATGLATRRKSEYNIVQTGEAVQFNLPQNGDAYNTSLFMQLLFQTGFTQLSHSAMTTAGMHIFQCAPYSSADTTYFGQFTRHMQPQSGTDSIDLVVRGGICHTMVVSGESGGVLTIEPTIYGGKWSQEDRSEQLGNSGTANPENSFANIVPLKFQDSTLAILDIDYDNTQTIKATFNNSSANLIDATSPSAGVMSNANGFVDATAAGAGIVLVENSVSNDGLYRMDHTNDDHLVLASASDGESTSFVDEVATVGVEVTPAVWRTINSPSVSLTFTNNCQFNYYNDDAASDAIVGRLNVEGTFSMPFGTSDVGNNYMIDRFLAGQEFMLAWYWGQSGSAANVGTDYRLQPDAALDRQKNDSAANDIQNYASFVVCARATDYEVSGDNEMMIDVTFQGVKTFWADAMKAYFAVDATYLDRI